MVQFYFLSAKKKKKKKKKKKTHTHTHKKSEQSQYLVIHIIEDSNKQQTNKFIQQLSNTHCF